jgi:FMN phosphatase YigB (HAD superfamily)
MWFNQSMNLNRFQAILFDWGDTVMKDDSFQAAPMVDWPTVEIVADVDRLLAFLHRNGRVIALATGAAVSDETQIRGALARVELDRYFKKIYCFGNTGEHKPSAAFYRFILNDLKIQPAEALMIGDSFEKDVLAANQVGLPAIWFNPSTPERRDGELYSTARSMTELLARFQPTT